MAFWFKAYSKSLSEKQLLQDIPESSGKSNILVNCAPNTAIIRKEQTTIKTEMMKAE